MIRRYVAPTQLGRRGSRAAQFLPRGQTPSSAQPMCNIIMSTRTSNYSARELSGIKLCNFTSNYFLEFGKTGLELFKFRRIVRRNTVCYYLPEYIFSTSHLLTLGARRRRVTVLALCVCVCVCVCVCLSVCVSVTTLAAVSLICTLELNY